MKKHVCPYLAIKEDPNTALDFPSQGNFCHHARPPAPVRGTYQQEYCLTNQHVNCPLFQAAAPQPMPAYIGVPAASRLNLRRALALAGIPAAVAGAAALAFAWNGISAQLASRGIIPQTGAEDRGQGGWSLIIGTDTPFAPITNTPLVETPLVNCPMPRGWVPYEVKPTDSLFRLSVVFGVSVEELQQVNCLGEETAILAGQTIYVPILPTGTPTLTGTPTRFVPTNTNTLVPADPIVLPVSREERPRPSATPVPPTAVPATAVPPTAIPATSVPRQPRPTNPPPPQQPTRVPPQEVKPDKPAKPTSKPKPTKKPKVDQDDKKDKEDSRASKDNKGKSDDKGKDNSGKDKGGGKGKNK